jgi:hypothetical protein
MLNKIVLTCVPTLAPLLTYFSEKTSNNYSTNNYSIAHELHYYCGGSRVNHITSAPKLAQGNADSDSQKGILDAESSLECKTESQRPGITKTVQVDVEYLSPMPDDTDGKRF